MTNYQFNLIGWPSISLHSFLHMLDHSWSLLSVYLVHLNSNVIRYVQVVCNANKLAKLVKEKKSNQNWLDYYQLKYARNQSQRPIMKVFCYFLSSSILVFLIIIPFFLVFWGWRKEKGGAVVRGRVVLIKFIYY